MPGGGPVTCAHVHPHPALWMRQTWSTGRAIGRDVTIRPLLLGATVGAGSSVRTGGSAPPPTTTSWARPTGIFVPACRPKRPGSEWARRHARCAWTTRSSARSRHAIAPTDVRVDGWRRRLRSSLSSASSPNATWPPGHVTSSSLGAQADRPASLLPSVPGCWRRGTAGPLQDRGPQDTERSWTDLQARARGRPRVGRGFLGHVDNRQ